jgi:hypothetical protein
MMRKGSEKTQVAAVKQLAVSSVMLLIQLAVFFLSAGYIGDRPWIFFGASFVHSLEDRVLCKESVGYAKYSYKVRYRLFPRIW